MTLARRSAKLPTSCSIGGLLELLTRPWTMHILWALSHDGSMRFGVLKKQIEGISGGLSAPKGPAAARHEAQNGVRWRIAADRVPSSR